MPGAMTKNMRKRLERKAFAVSVGGRKSVPYSCRVTIHQGGENRSLVFTSRKGYDKYLSDNAKAIEAGIIKLVTHDEIKMTKGHIGAMTRLTNKGWGLGNDKRHVTPSVTRGKVTEAKQRHAIDGHRVHNYPDQANNPYSGIIAETGRINAKRTK